MFGASDALVIWLIVVYRHISHVLSSLRCVWKTQRSHVCIGCSPVGYVQFQEEENSDDQGNSLLLWQKMSCAYMRIYMKYMHTVGVLTTTFACIHTSFSQVKEKSTYIMENQFYYA